MAAKFHVLFRVQVVTYPGEVACLTGECAELGSWDPQKTVRLCRETTRQCSADGVHSGTANNKGDIWSQKICMNGLGKVKYRYCIARILCSGNGDDEELVVTRWETNIKPRVFAVSDNIAVESTEDKLDVFGEYGGQHHVTSGWLVNQLQIEISFHDPAITIWKDKYRNGTFSIKCTPKDFRRDDHAHNNGEQLPVSASSFVTVSILDKGYAKPSPQQSYGTLYRPDHTMCFHIQTTRPQDTGLQLDFYHHENIGDFPEKGSMPEYIGYSFLLPFKENKSQGHRTVPIFSQQHQPLGQITLQYLLIKPLIGQKFTMKVSYQNYWNSNRRTMEIGHRGMGKSYSEKCKMLATTRENTIGSFAEAASHGADYVEMDVHLTKDREVIVFHDFKVPSGYEKKRRGEVGLLQVPVKDLTLSELQQIKLHLTSQSENRGENDCDTSSDDLEPEDLQPFPTLEKCLNTVDIDTGFNIEFKYPQMLMNGVHEQDNYFDLNDFVDMILQVVFKHHGGRRIIFSCFDCDTCIVLQLKQNVFPVLFLTQGKTTSYDWYRDPRTLSVHTAAEFAIAHGLLGVDVMSQLLLKDQSLIQYIKSQGLVLFTWGEENNNLETIDKLKRFGLDGIIYDRIDKLKTSGKESIFKVEKKMKG